MSRVLATTLYRITGRLGGKSRPRLPAEVTRPTEKSSGYWSLSRIGSTRPPKAMMVTPEPPVKVVNIAHTAATITASPPGIQPNRARKKRSRRLEAWLSARM